MSRFITEILGGTIHEFFRNSIVQREVCKIAKRCSPSVESGVATLTTNGTDQTFSFPHGMSTTPTSVAVTISSESFMTYLSATADDTDITVNFGAAPPASSLNVYWQAYK